MFKKKPVFTGFFSFCKIYNKNSKNRLKLILDFIGSTKIFEEIQNNGNFI